MIEECDKLLSVRIPSRQYEWLQSSAEAVDMKVADFVRLLFKTAMLMNEKPFGEVVDSVMVDMSAGRSLEEQK